MKRLIPTFTEVSVLAVLAIASAIIVNCVANQAAGLFLLTFPLALGASLMGARRSGFLSANRGRVQQVATVSVEQAAE